MQFSIFKWRAVNWKRVFISDLKIENHLKNAVWRDAFLYTAVAKVTALEKLEMESVVEWGMGMQLRHSRDLILHWLLHSMLFGLDNCSSLGFKGEHQNSEKYPVFYSFLVWCQLALEDVVTAITDIRAPTKIIIIHWKWKMAWTIIRSMDYPMMRRHWCHDWMKPTANCSWTNSNKSSSSRYVCRSGERASAFSADSKRLGGGRRGTSSSCLPGHSPKSSFQSSPSPGWGPSGLRAVDSGRSDPRLRPRPPRLRPILSPRHRWGWHLQPPGLFCLRLVLIDL